MGSAPAPGRSRRRPRRRHRCARVRIKTVCAPHQGSARGRAEQQPGLLRSPSVLSVCSLFQWIGERARPGRSRRRPRRRHPCARVRIKTVCAPHEGSARERAEQQPGRLRSGSGPLAARHFINLGKFTSAGAAVEFINCFLGEILPSGDVDGFEPTLLPPAPGGALRHPHLLQPSGKADDRRAVRIPFAVRFNFHKFGILPPALKSGSSDCSRTRTPRELGLDAD